MAASKTCLNPFFRYFLWPEKGPRGICLGSKGVELGHVGWAEVVGTGVGRGSTLFCNSPALPCDKVELWIRQIKDTQREHFTHIVWQFLSLERQKHFCAFHPLLITFKVCLSWDATQFCQTSAYHVPLRQVLPLFALFAHDLFVISILHKGELVVSLWPTCDVLGPLH